MRFKMRALLAAVALVLTGLVGMSPPASAAAGVVVCAVGGFVGVDPGVGRIPPGSGTPPGTYNFGSVALVCVGANDNPLPTSLGGQGTMIGAGSATSSGDFGWGACGGADYPLIGSFCGSYDASGFAAGGECHGNVGGKEMGMNTVGPPAVIDGGPPGDPTTIPGNVAAGNWSITFGPLILGGITCDSGSYDDSSDPTKPFPTGGGLLDGVIDENGVGALALVAVPVATAMGGTPSPPLPSSTCNAPNRQAPPAPIPDPGEPAAVWFCEILIAGVAVMESL
ncbi:MAG TPA: hypothetical protein VF230_16880 [Acidimicrobiales bacterium]